MQLILDHVCAVRGPWTVSAHAVFGEGLHLVSGDVGSGKSTLALLMAGFFAPKNGTVRKEEIQSCMLSLQFPEYHVTGLTLSEECASWGLSPQKILTSAALWERKDASPFSLSRGELKRLHLACVLATEYDLLLLDEPFSSLDCYQKQQLCDQLERRSTGITVLFTHEQAILPKTDRIWEIADGRLTDCGPLPDAFRHWRHAPPHIKKLLAAGAHPANLRPADLLEAACRIHG